MYLPRSPWLVGGLTEAEFDRKIMRDRLSHLKTCIANSLIAMGYDDQTINKYYLDVVCGILPRSSNEGGPEAAMTLQVRRALVYVNHPTVLAGTIGEIDVAQAKLEAAGGLPSFQNAQTVASLEELISDTPQVNAARSSEDYSRVLRPGRDDIDLVITGRGSESQRLATEKFTNDEEALSGWGTNIGLVGLLKTHRVVTSALQLLVGQGTADGLTRGLVFLRHASRRS